MLKFVIFSIIVSFLVALFPIDNIRAIDSNIVISQIQLGDIDSARNEFIEIYNNGQYDIEITDWCLIYISSGLSSKKLTCFAPSDINKGLFLPSHNYALAVSTDIANLTNPINGDVLFAPTLAGASGYVKLVDNNDIEIDIVGWGVNLDAMDLVAPPVAGTVIGRKISIDAENTFQDSNINVDDFEITIPKAVYSYGNLYEERDLCLNLVGFQSSLPDGYIMISDGNCEEFIIIDICQNIEGIQIMAPEGHLVDEDNNCHIDVCPNIDGLQQIIPEEMEQDINVDCVEKEIINDCSLALNGEVLEGCNIEEILNLRITELLPNAVGSDIGSEFIEIYNPNEFEISLDDYVLHIGVSSVNKYKFPQGLMIGAGEYLAFYNDIIKFTLLNSSIDVKLKLNDETLVDEINPYLNPEEGRSWSFIEGLWQYTNQITPNEINLPDIVLEEITEGKVGDIKDEDGKVLIVSNLAPCAPNQYRNPETNRCKLIVEPSSELAPCKEGQYRSEETNRCRSIVSDIATYLPCAEGEERNPETNRCRKIAVVLGTSILAPCPEGQERNPETNRCRNVVKSMPEVGYAPEQTIQKSNNYILWWSLAGVGLIAVSYGVWEWRQEIVKIINKVGLFLHIVK